MFHQAPCEAPAPISLFIYFVFNSVNKLQEQVVLCNTVYCFYFKSTTASHQTFQIAFTPIFFFFNIFQDVAAENKCILIRATLTLHQLCQLFTVSQQLLVLE